MTRRASVLALTSGAAAGFALLAVALIAGPVAARGWLCAFVLVSTVPIGALALLLVHGISGGRWGHDLAPVLVPAARCLPLLLIAFLPLLVFRSAIYQWDDLELPQDVRDYYLSPVFFDGRTLIALSAWSALAWCRAWRSPLFAGLGLVAHLILTTFIPADWALTLSPGSTSAGFGLGFGIEQIGAALAVAAVLGPQGRDPRANGDLAGMIVSTVLGTVYFVYMQFIVTWYGNIPAKVHWYTARTTAAWPLLAVAAFALGAALPFLGILNPAVRREPALLKIVGGFVLVGVALHVAWLTMPAFGPAAAGPAALAALAMALPIATATRLWPEAPIHGS